MKTSYSTFFKHVLFITGCMLVFHFKGSAQCHPSFTFAVNHYTKTVNFTNTTASSGLTYVWKFGSGTNSTVTSPVKTYPAYGTYYVWLVASSGTTCRDSAFAQVTINNPCDANFYPYAYSSNYKEEYFYPNNWDTTASYLWTFGDSSSSTLRQPIHTYANYGAYAVCLRVMNNHNGDSCNTQFCQTVNVVDSNLYCKAVFEGFIDNANSLYVNRHKLLHMSRLSENGLRMRMRNFLRS